VDRSATVAQTGTALDADRVAAHFRQAAGDRGGPALQQGIAADKNRRPRHSSEGTAAANRAATVMERL